MADRERAAAVDRAAKTSVKDSAGRPVIVDTQDKLERLTREISGCGVLGLDTEFVRERTYYPRPGLIQLSDGKTVWLVDLVTLEDLDGFAAILHDPASLKVLHSAGEDLELLQLVCRALPDPLFDTQIAAAMLGKSLQCRYEHLVEEMLGIKLDGGQARSNWRRRPLPPVLLEYAAQDVAWLPMLHAALSAELERCGRLEWLNEDCARLIEAARTPEDPMQTLVRIKGAGRLGDEALARLAVFAWWRDEQARRRDLPRSFVLRDEVMLELSRRAPASARELAEIEGIPRQVLRRDGERLLEIIAAGGQARFRRPPELELLDRAQRTRLAALQHKVRELGAELGVEPALIASKRELVRLVQGLEPDWLQGWRGALLADVPG